MKSPRGQHRRSDSSGGSTGRSDCNLSAILGVLEDSDCRSILEATSSEALTAKELSDRCGFSSSTAYRKLDELTEVGLLEERTRFDVNGAHTSEYRLSLRNLEISLDGGSIDAKFSTLDQKLSYKLTD